MTFEIDGHRNTTESGEPGKQINIRPRRVEDMVDSTSPETHATPAADVEAPAKQAACLACRSIKIKCLRDSGATACKRCTNKGVSCTIPDYRVGRRKGVPK